MLTLCAPIHNDAQLVLVSEAFKAPHDVGVVESHEQLYGKKALRQTLAGAAKSMQAHNHAEACRMLQLTLASCSEASRSAFGMRLMSISLMTKFLPSLFLVTNTAWPKLPFPKTFPRVYLSYPLILWVWVGQFRYEDANGKL